MPNRADILWFKQQFHAPIEAAVAGTPFDLDMLTAIACQESGEIWPILRKKPLTVPQIVALCVGDTLDADKGRKAFPKNKAALIAKPNGQEMFDIAHAALVSMAEQIPAYRPAARNPNKFCHGYGVFQYDLQFFLTDPDYFLQKKYEQFDGTLGKALSELKEALQKTPFKNKTSLTDMEMAGVAIAYNAGSFNPSKGLKQGHFDGQKFYGEAFFDFLQLSRTVALPGAMAALAEPRPGNAIIPPPTPVAASGATHRVATLESTLRLRSAPTLRVSQTLAAGQRHHRRGGPRAHAADRRSRRGLHAAQTGRHHQAYRDCRPAVAQRAEPAGSAGHDAR
jgi:hypothetical protein